jgi:acetyl esterase/lipase
MIGTGRPTWQIEEFLTLPPLFARIFWANKIPADVKYQRIAYDAHSHQYALLFFPANLDRWQRTALFFIPGSWRKGNPHTFRYIGYFFARLGFPTILSGYRPAPAYKFPTQLEDACRSLEAGLKLMQKKGLSIDNLILGGHSTGAQLASLLAYDQRESTRRYLSQADIAGLLLISAPLNFSLCQAGNIFRLIAEYVHDRAGLELADPIRHVQGDEDFSVLCIHGQKDPMLDLQNALTFAAQVKPGLSRVHIAMGAHHSDLHHLYWNEEHPVATSIRSWLRDCTIRTHAA